MAKYDGSDFQVISDQTIDGIRYIEAYPSAFVCSQLIKIELKDDIIASVIYIGGCSGNAKGIGALIKGMSINEAIMRLNGITCGSKPTSCPDQLARILSYLK